MFAVSGLYNYATASKSNSTTSSTPTATRVKRHPNNRSRPNTATSPSNPDVEDQPPPSYASVAAASSTSDETELAKRAIVDDIIKEPDLYKVLGVKDRKAKTDEIRRCFLNRSRVCHPDKFPNYQPSTLAFQRVVFAYETLSKPNSRRIYDVSGRHDLAAAMNGNGTAAAPNANSAGMDGGDETLNGVLYSVFCEFMEGDFEMIRVLVSAMNEGNPGLNLGEEAVENLEGAFHKMREFMLNGKKYLSIIRFELIRLYEIQHSLRQLSYFDVFGRLRLTLQLAKVTIGIPLAIDQAMKDGDDKDQDRDEDENESEDEDGERKKRESDEEEDESEEDWRNKPNWRSSNNNPPKESDEFGIAPESDEDEDEESYGERVRRERREKRKEMKERERKLRRMNLKNGKVNNNDDGRSRRKSSTTTPTKDQDRNGEQNQDERKERSNFRNSTSFRNFNESQNQERNERRKSTSFRDEEDLHQDQDEDEEDDDDQEEEETEEEIENENKQKKKNPGLFGPTTSRLLGGVVKVLETSESWVPGKRTPE